MNSLDYKHNTSQTLIFDKICLLFEQGVLAMTDMEIDSSCKFFQNLE
jgi:hypothetical protein